MILKVSGDPWRTRWVQWAHLGPPWVVLGPLRLGLLSVFFSSGVRCSASTLKGMSFRTQPSADLLTLPMFYRCFRQNPPLHFSAKMAPEGGQGSLKRGHVGPLGVLLGHLGSPFFLLGRLVTEKCKFQTCVFYFNKLCVFEGWGGLERVR